MRALSGDDTEIFDIKDTTNLDIEIPEGVDDDYTKVC